MTRTPMLLACFAVLATPACRTENVLHRLDFSWNRMQVQPRYDAYETSRFFEDGTTMRAPPPGTVPYAEQTAAPELDGKAGGAYVTTIPVPIDRRLLDEGRSNFEVTCAICHGVLGDGKTVVAEYMGRRPPSLVDPAILVLPPGRLYEIVRDGYGLMPSYANHLTVTDRWAVIAYLRALQRSQHAVVAELPSSERDQLARSAP